MVGSFDELGLIGDEENRHVFARRNRVEQRDSLVWAHLVERAVENVMSTPLEGRIRRLMPMLSLAASIVLILGLGVAFSEAMKPDPCVTFACQLEAMSDEELAGMMELMEEESLLDVEGDAWTNLY